MVSNQGYFQTSDYAALQRQLELADSSLALFKAIVNAPFDYKIKTVMMYLGIISFFMVTTRTGTINRKTTYAHGLAGAAGKAPKRLHIPETDTQNLVSRAIQTGTPQATAAWNDIFCTENQRDDASLDQAASAIAYCAIYPLQNAGVKGAMVFDYYQYKKDIGRPQEEFMETYTRIVSERLRNR